MTEAEWMECDHPPAMLGWLAKQVVARKGRRAGPQRDRRFRLFACACLRRAWERLPPTCRRAVEYMERYADGGNARTWYRESGKVRGRNSPGSEVKNLFWEGFNLPASVISISTATEGHGADAPAQLALVRCLFGNPFRPLTPDPAWLKPAVVGLAQAAYGGRILPSGELDPLHLVALADALEDAGCDDADVLAHLRGPGPHARGCHVVDAVLGRT
jgi:hypothetical protein